MHVYFRLTRFYELVRNKSKKTWSNNKSNVDRGNKTKAYRSSQEENRASEKDTHAHIKSSLSRCRPAGDAWSRLATMVNLLDKLEYSRDLLIQAADAEGRVDGEYYAPACINYAKPGVLSDQSESSPRSRAKR